MYGASATNSHRGGASFSSHQPLCLFNRSKERNAWNINNKCIPIEENDLHHAAILSKYHDAACMWKDEIVVFVCKQTNEQTVKFSVPPSAPLALTYSRSQSTRTHHIDFHTPTQLFAFESSMIVLPSVRKQWRCRRVETLLTSQFSKGKKEEIKNFGNRKNLSREWDRLMSVIAIFSSCFSLFGQCQSIGAGGLSQSI